MSATEGLGKGLAPYLVLGAIVAGVWLFRDQIAGWFQGVLIHPVTQAVDNVVHDVGQFGQDNPVGQVLTAPARGIATIADWLTAHPEDAVIAGQQGTGIVPWSYNPPTAEDIANAQILAVDSNITPWADNPVLHDLSGAVVVAVSGGSADAAPGPEGPGRGSTLTFDPTVDPLGFVIQPSETIVGILGVNKVGEPIEIRHEGDGGTILLSHNEGTTVIVGGDVAQNIVAAAQVGRVVVPWAPTHTWAPGEEIPHIFAGEQAGALAVLDANWHQQFGGS